MYCLVSSLPFIIVYIFAEVVEQTDGTANRNIILYIKCAFADVAATDIVKNTAPGRKIKS